MAPRHPACCFRSLKTRTQINEEGAGNNCFLISSQAALLIWPLSLKGQGTRDSMPPLTSRQFFLKEYKVSKVHLQYKIDQTLHRSLKGLFVSCYTQPDNGSAAFFITDKNISAALLMCRIRTVTCPHSICFNIMVTALWIYCYYCSRSVTQVSGTK